MMVNDVSALQLLTSEEMEFVGGGRQQECTVTTCSPSFTCQRTTCSETVCDNTKMGGA